MVWHAVIDSSFSPAQFIVSFRKGKNVFIHVIKTAQVTNPKRTGMMLNRDSFVTNKKATQKFIAKFFRLLQFLLLTIARI